MSTTADKWRAMLAQRCPRCGQGRIYETGSRMHESCPVCGLVYSREPGYFIGALYISYGVASAVMIAALFGLHLLLPEWDLGWLVLIVGALFLPFVPLVTRYARVLWIYFDRWAWPTSRSE